MAHITTWRIGVLLAAASICVGVLPAVAATADANGQDVPPEIEAPPAVPVDSLGEEDHLTFDFQTGEPIENPPAGLSAPSGFNASAVVNAFKFTVKLA